MNQTPASTCPINIAIASYDTFIANGLASSLQTKKEFTIKGILSTEEIPGHPLLKQDVDILIIHPRKIDIYTYNAIDGALSSCPHVKKILLLPQDNLQPYLQAINMGVQGVLIYSRMTLIDLSSAIQEVYAGKQFIAPLITSDIMSGFHRTHPQPYICVPKNNTLTAREVELLSYLIKGLSNREIARELQIEMKTVKNHLTHIYSKLQVQNRVEAIVCYYASSPEKGRQSRALEGSHRRIDA